MHPNVQKLLVFGLITFFVVTWSSFLGQGGLPSKAEETKKSKNPILNSTLGVCPLPSSAAVSC